jgi:hypothetical protein
MTPTIEEQSFFLGQRVLLRQPSEQRIQATSSPSLIGQRWRLPLLRAGDKGRSRLMEGRSLLNSMARLRYKPTSRLRSEIVTLDRWLIGQRRDTRFLSLKWMKLWVICAVAKTGITSSQYLEGSSRMSGPYLGETSCILSNIFCFEVRYTHAYGLCAALNLCKVKVNQV